MANVACARVVEGRATRAARCLLLGAVALGSLLLVAGAAVAQPSAAAAFALGWRAPVGCPAAAEVNAALLRAAGSVRPVARLQVDAVVERVSRRRFSAHLRFSGAIDAERELAGDACDALAAASVWLIADVLAGLPQRGAEPAAEQQPIAPPPRANDAPPPRANAAPPSAAMPLPSNGAPRQPPASNAPTVPPPKRTPPTAALSLAVWAWLDSGALPGFTGGPGVEVALATGPFRFALRPRGFLPRSLERQGLRVRAFMLELPVQGCYVVRYSDAWVGPCASVVPGLVRASASGLPQTHAATGGWLALEAALAAGLTISRQFQLQAELSLVRPVIFPRSSVEPIGVVQHADPVFMRAGLAFGLHF